MTREEFLKVITVLTAGLDRKMPAEQMEIWFALLERFPYAAAKQAVLRHLSESRDSFLPAPGVIVQLTVEALCGQSESAESAYQRLCRIRIEWGADVHRGELVARPHIDDSLWAVIEGLGGWERFCGERDGSQATEFAQFRNAWDKATTEAILSVAIPSQSQPRLSGQQPKIYGGAK